MKQFLITVAGVLAGLVLFMFIAPIALYAMIPKGPPQPSQMVLTLDLREAMSDQSLANPLFGGSPALLDTLIKLDAAREDDDVKGLYIRANTDGMAPAQAEELRAAIAAFRASGKFVIAHLQTDGVRMSMPGYMTVADADEVWLQETSEFQPMGLSAEVTFMAGTLQRYHMQAQFERREDHKTAAHTLTERTFTREHREQLTGLMTGMYDLMIANIAADRELAPQAVRAAVEATPLTAQQALEQKLIDKIGRPQDAEAAAQARAAAAEFLDIARYQPPQRSGGDVIAVIHGEGAIVSGPGEYDLFGGEPMMNGDAIAAALLDASDDPKVKAIVFRVASPGGSVVASDQIQAALRTARERGKPVVVSMGDVAASGGYYVAAHADEIVASPTTITGSIGVIGGKLIIGPAFDHYLSTNTETLTVGSPMVEMFSSERPFTNAERAVFSAFIQRTYDVFIGLVAEGRELTTAQVRALAGGRVWTGQQALERKLVDQLGGFQVAVARARALAGIGEGERVRLRMFPERKSPFEAIGQLFGASSAEVENLARVNAALSDPRLRRALAALREEDANVRAEAEMLSVR